MPVVGDLLGAMCTKQHPQSWANTLEILICRAAELVRRSVLYVGVHGSTLAAGKHVADVLDACSLGRCILDGRLALLYSGEQLHSILGMFEVV